ncbi:trypco2 family protein [Streptomyces sp. NPDC057074]|uniref:trypco2 family protein n=1 Tax=Streptomyces sp. NPDC057074 TaxID=3346015 RepID=UPI0036339BEE
MVLELAAVVRELRRELDRASRAAEGEQIQFGLGPIELEVTLMVTEEASATGRIKFWVVEAGADGKAIEAKTHRVNLTLQPTRGNRPFEIGGMAREDED